MKDEIRLTSIAALLVSEVQRERSAGVAEITLSSALYLADWWCALTRGERLVSYDGYGGRQVDWLASRAPFFTHTIERHLASNLFFKTVGVGLGHVTRFRIDESWRDHIEINDYEKKMADFILEKTNKLNSERIKAIVLGTQPLSASTVYEHLDLVRSAKEFHDANPSPSKITPNPISLSTFN